MFPFPREIVDLVVAHIPYDAASLLFVSPIFRAAARAAIFRRTTITFSLPRHNPRLGVLIQVIEGDRSVLNAIQELAIHIGKDPLKEYPSETGEFVAIDDHFTTLIPLLCNAPILKLEVKGAYRSLAKTGLSMSELLPEEVEGLIALRSLPSLVEFSILELSEFSPLLLTHPTHQITTLNFSPRFIRGGRQAAPLEMDKRVFKRGPIECRILLGLQNLRIHSPYEFLFPIWNSLQQHTRKPSICMPTLTSLSVRELAADDLDALAAIVASCLILETLELRCSCSSLPTFTNCDALRKASPFSTLHVDFSLNINQGHMAFHLRSLARFLKAYAPAPHLQKVIASVDWEHKMSPHTLVILRDCSFPELREAFASLRSPTLLFVLRVSFLQGHTHDTSTLDKDRAALKDVLDEFVFTEGVKFVYELLPSRPAPLRFVI